MARARKHDSEITGARPTFWGGIIIGIAAGVILTIISVRLFGYWF